MKKILLLLVLPVLVLTSVEGQQFRAVIDHRSEWLAFENGNFIPFDSRTSDTDVVYFNIDAKRADATVLNVFSVRPVNLFVNNKLAASASKLILNIDSLSRVYASTNLLVGVYQDDLSEGEIKTLSGNISNPTFDDALAKRSPTAYRDFVIVGLLLLIILAVSILRLNPKLAADYFSIPGIFSMRETDEGQVYTRIGNSTNILFYAFCSMLLSYYLIVIFHFVSSEYASAVPFAASDFSGFVFSWSKLTGILLVVFFLRIVVVYGVSYLFGISEVAGIHFFNWVRFLLVIVGLLAISLFLYVVWHGQNISVHTTLLQLLGWSLGAWMILVFFKLVGKVNGSMFHLFSYICATELIPFLFLIRVLYK